MNIDAKVPNKILAVCLRVSIAVRHQDQRIFCFVFVFFFETGFLCVALAVLELTL